MNEEGKFSEGICEIVEKFEKKKLKDFSRNTIWITL